MEAKNKQSSPVGVESLILRDLSPLLMAPNVKKTHTLGLKVYR